MSFTFGTGKGLREPASPYRTAYVFGADLNVPNADGWNAIPQLVEPTQTFDLSEIDPGHEVVVAVLGATNTRAGLYNVTVQWFRVRDNKLLYDYRFSREQLSGGWMYTYSYLGYVSWEIYENGYYDVKVIVTGPENYIRSLRIGVTGIVQLPELPVVAGNFIQGITSRLASAAEFAYAAWIEVESWVFPFSLLAAPLYGLGQVFDWLVVHFLDFGTWVNTVTERLDDILSESDIVDLIRDWITHAESAWYWIENAWQNVNAIIESWWTERSLDVMVWIDHARDQVLALVNNLSTTVNNLALAWEDFQGRIPALDQVITWFGDLVGNIQREIEGWWRLKILEVQGLIDSAFLARETFWSGWQDIRDKVVEFFGDPEDQVLKLIERALERFW